MEVSEYQKIQMSEYLFTWFYLAKINDLYYLFE